MAPQARAAVGPATRGRGVKTCSLCGRKDRSVIDSAIAAGVESLRTIADRYGVAHQTVLRHREHVRVELLAKGEADRLWAELAAQRAKLEEERLAARKAGQHSAAVAAIREQTRLIEVRLQALGELDGSERERKQLEARVRELESTLSRIDPNTLTPAERVALSLTDPIHGELLRQAVLAETCMPDGGDDAAA